MEQINIFFSLLGRIQRPSTLKHVWKKRGFSGKFEKFTFFGGFPTFYVKRPNFVGICNLFFWHRIFGETELFPRMVQRRLAVFPAQQVEVKSKQCSTRCDLQILPKNKDKKTNAKILSVPVPAHNRRLIGKNYKPFAKSRKRYFLSNIIMYAIFSTINLATSIPNTHLMLYRIEVLP